MSFDTKCFSAGIMSPGMDRDLDGNTLAYGRRGERGGPTTHNTKQQRAARLLAKEASWSPKAGKRARLHASRIARLSAIAKGKQP